MITLRAGAVIEVVLAVAVEAEEEMIATPYTIVGLQIVTDLSQTSVKPTPTRTALNTETRTTISTSNSRSSRRISLCAVSYRDLSIAFPRMLKGLAQDLYFTTMMGKSIDFKVLWTTIRDRFEDANFHRKIMLEWNSQELSTTKLKYSDRSTSECFDLLVAKLQNLRHGLQPDLRTDNTLHMRLVLACRSSNECTAACALPPSDLYELIASIKSSIITWKAVHPKRLPPSTTYKTEDDTEAYVTGRRFMSNQGTGS